MHLPPDQILEKAIRAYREWRAAQPLAKDQVQETASVEEIEDEVEKPNSSFVLESAESQALAEIEAYVNAMAPYEFQEVVAALLRGMGYATPFEAAPGPDGGTDILAYPDPIGAKTPHVRCRSSTAHLRKQHAKKLLR